MGYIYQVFSPKKSKKLCIICTTNQLLKTTESFGFSYSLAIFVMLLTP